MAGWREAMESEAAVDFAVPSRERDFALIVEGRPLYVDADFLASQSPVLRQLMAGPWKEAAAKEAEFPNQRYEDVLELIRCLCFTPYQAKVTEENVSLLLAFASELFIADLDRRCSQFLRTALDNSPSPELLALIAALGLQYDKEQMATEALPQLARHSFASLKELSESGAMPASVGAAVWRAKATKVANTEAIAAPHEYDEKPFRLWGASRRVCYRCRRVSSSATMDRCLKCEWDHCHRCKAYPHCYENPITRCKGCAKPENGVGGNPLPFKVDTEDQCTCWLKTPPPDRYIPPKANAETTAAPPWAEDFEYPDQLRDFSIRVQGRRIYVNVGFVGTVSPVLAKMAAEAGSDGVEVLGHSYADMLEFFRCICPNPATKPVLESNVHLLLQLAAEFQMVELKLRCEDFLQRKLESPDKSAPGFDLNEHRLSILILASKYKLEDLLRKVFPRLASQPFSALDELANSGAVPPHIVAALCQAKSAKWAGALVKISPHTFGERRDRLRGASRRRCFQCKHVFSSVRTDKCKFCQQIFCKKDFCLKYCEANVHRHCRVCLDASTSTPKKLGPPFKVDEADPCHCGFTGEDLPLHYLYSAH